MTLPRNIIYLIPGRRTWKKYKDSSEVSDLLLDWREFLEQGEAISTLTTSAKNITVDSSSSSGQTCTLFLSGGGANSTAYIDVTITTGNATPRTFKVRVHFEFERDRNYEDDYYYT